jgi:hypothetical protein
MTSNKGNTPPSPLMQPNVAGAAGMESKYLLPIAFVYAHPDVITEKITQPIFQTPHTLNGPETHRQENSDYGGALHLCEQPDGEYKLTFDEFNMEEETFE